MKIIFDGFSNNAKLQSIIQALLLNIAQFREKNMCSKIIFFFSTSHYFNYCDDEELKCFLGNSSKDSRHV